MCSCSGCMRMFLLNSSFHQQMSYCLENASERRKARATIQLVSNLTIAIVDNHAKKRTKMNINMYTYTDLVARSDERERVRNQLLDEYFFRHKEHVHSRWIITMTLSIYLIFFRLVSLFRHDVFFFSSSPPSSSFSSLTDSSSMVGFMSICRYNLVTMLFRLKKMREEEERKNIYVRSLSFEDGFYNSARSFFLPLSLSDRVIFL